MILFAREHLKDVLRQPFIKAPISRGIGRLRVVSVHAMKVSLPAFLTLIAANLGHLITSMIIVETIFGIPGLGSALYRAIFQRDRSLIIAMLILLTVAVSLFNLLVDAAHLILDPRTRQER
jgi:ABC-type dipeptide/oligopeptide/nickel transport system permease component